MIITLNFTSRAVRIHKVHPRTQVLDCFLHRFGLATSLHEMCAFKVFKISIGSKSPLDRSNSSYFVGRISGNGPAGVFARPTGGLSLLGRAA